MPRKNKPADADAQSQAVEDAISKVRASGAEGTDPATAGALNEKIRQLIRLSKEQGYLTFDDINEALPDSVENQDEIDNVLSILNNLDIEILEPDQVEGYKQRQEEAEEEETRTSQNDILDDPDVTTESIAPCRVSYPLQPSAVIWPNHARFQLPPHPVHF